MKKITKLNHQLFLTTSIMIVMSIFIFGIILPNKMKVFFENRIYNHILEIQNYLSIEDMQRYNGYDQVYHMIYNQESLRLEQNIDEEIFHQRLMYKNFFIQVQRNAKFIRKAIEKHKYIEEYETVYYVTNKLSDNEILISYKIQKDNTMFSKQLFINVFPLLFITIVIILIIFFKWNARLINNLKEIQNKLDQIGRGCLEEPIEIINYTEEFQEVMNSLEDMRQSLYENDQVKKEMIHNISHDLKTPLSVIKNYAEGIIDSVYPYGTVEETAHVIYDQADRLQKKVQRLLYLNRLEYIKSQNERFEAFELKGVLFEVMEYMQDRDGKLKMTAQVDASFFDGDEEKWRIVLENLIDNAKRYADTWIHLQIEQGEFTIYNDGVPIEEKIIGSLFNPFEVGKGGVTGLGLSIVKKTIELYGYKIEIRNEKDGVTFRIFKIT